MLHEIDLTQNGPHGQAMADAVSTCVHCGFCLSACPTYEQLGDEADSPRGRIFLMKEVLEGKLDLEAAAPHVDRCLGCLACEPACPSGVPYRDLISPFRAATAGRRRVSWLQRMARRVVQLTLPYPGRFRIAATMGRWSRPLVEAMPAFLVPRVARAMLGLLPDQLPKRSETKAFYPATGEQRGVVAMLRGCAQTVLAPEINAATIRVLTANGIEVHVPENQVCCGALSWHVGNLRGAQGFANQNLDAFDRQDAPWDAVLTNAAGCGSGLHEYGLILAGTDRQTQAETFAAKVSDVSRYLSRLSTRKAFPDRGTTTRIAYHDACHLANAQGVRSEPRALLRAIPGVTLVEITDGHLCCGSAGTYNIDQPDMANQLGDAKARAILATEPDVIATGNIGCLTQIRTHLKRVAEADGMPLTELPSVRHTVEILADAYDGVDLARAAGR
ncbi:MAG: heterodisulfide reductase-related iron-sulfur binding cluster [Planctomycetota bacterium]